MPPRRWPTRKTWRGFWQATRVPLACGLEQQQQLPALSLLRSQLEEALGLEFAGEKGDHFFRSTLVQTLFYGVFAAWVLWSRQGDRGVEDRERFEWELASRTLDVPFISALF